MFRLSSGLKAIAFVPYKYLSNREGSHPHLWQTKKPPRGWFVCLAERGEKGIKKANSFAFSFRTGARLARPGRSPTDPSKRKKPATLAFDVLAEREGLIRDCVTHPYGASSYRRRLRSLGFAAHFSNLRIQILPTHHHPKTKKPHKGAFWFLNLAEREGFEPSIPCGIHTFQACSFGHSDTSPNFSLTALAA